MMKNLFITAAILAAFSAPQVFAQAKNLQGFSVGANVNVVTASSEVTSGGLLVRLGEGSVNGSVQGAYTFALTDSFLIGLGGTYTIGDTKAGTATVNGIGVTATGTNPQFGLYIEPGFAVGSSTELYGKLSYNRMDGKLLLTNGTSVGGTLTFSGVGFGAGVRTFFDKNLYAQVEFNQVNYSGQTSFGITYKPSGTSGSLGMGYKF